MYCNVFIYFKHQIVFFLNNCATNFTILKKVEIYRNITIRSLISGKSIQDVISQYLLSSTSEDALIPLPCEVISSMAGFFSYTFSTRCPTQPPWTQGDGATPRPTTLRWRAQDRLAQSNSPDVTLACDDQRSLDTSAGILAWDWYFWDWEAGKGLDQTLIKEP